MPVEIAQGWNAVDVLFQSLGPAAAKEQGRFQGGPGGAAPPVKFVAPPKKNVQDKAPPGIRTES